eukprot:gene21771-22733_t
MPRLFCLLMLLVGVLAPRPAMAVETFSAAALLNGTSVTRPACGKLAHAVFVEAEGEGICIRYYTGGQELAGREAVVFFTGDVIGTDGKGHLTADKGYLTGAPEYLEAAARVWSGRLKAPVIFFARMGMHGSSGWHVNRRTRLEIGVTRAALDASKAREGLAGFHLVGQSGGGILAEAVAAVRDDVRCVVLASTPLDFALFARTFGITVRTDGKRAHWNPDGDIAGLAARPNLRAIAIHDPADTIVPTAVVTNFTARLAAAGRPVLLLETGARGVEHHALTEKALFVTGMCLAGASDAEIEKAYGHTDPDDLPPPQSAAAVEWFGMPCRGECGYSDPSRRGDQNCLGQLL